MNTPPVDSKPVSPWSELSAFLPWLAADVLLVLLFALIGRLSHSEPISIGAVFLVAYPFILGLLAGWAASYRLGFPVNSTLGGLTIWFSTLALGMILRALTGGGVQFSFIVVAGIFLLLMLVVPRIVRFRILVAQENPDETFEVSAAEVDAAENQVTED